MEPGIKSHICQRASCACQEQQALDEATAHHVESSEGNAFHGETYQDLVMDAMDVNHPTNGLPLDDLGSWEEILWAHLDPALAPLLEALTQDPELTIQEEREHDH